MNQPDASVQKPQESSTFEKAVKTLQKQMKGIPENECHEWLRTLHSNYTQRFTTDNERIWSTGAIMIPLALSGFVAFANMKGPCLAQAFIIGFPSILLMLAWIFIAENHRAFQEKSLAWIDAIEKEAGISQSIDHKLETNLFNRFFTFRWATQVIRIVLLVLTIVGWLWIWIAWY